LSKRAIVALLEEGKKKKKKNIVGFASQAFTRCEERHFTNISNDLRWGKIMTDE